ncbi:hypothetical protein PV326_002897, partial [Microctonus aethiopoides]
TRQGTEPGAEASFLGACSAVGPSTKDDNNKETEEYERKNNKFESDYRGLWEKQRSEIGPGCSQEQDVGSAATLEGKIFTVVNKFLTTSPLVNKFKLLMGFRFAAAN